MFKRFILAFLFSMFASIGYSQVDNEIRNDKFALSLSPVSSMKVTKTNITEDFMSVLLKDSSKQADSWTVAYLANKAPKECGLENEKKPVNTLSEWVQLCQMASFWHGYTGKGKYTYVIHGESEPSHVKLGGVDMVVEHKKVTINNYLTLAVAFLWGRGQVGEEEVWYFIRLSNYERYQNLQGSKELDAILSGIKLGVVLPQ